MTVLSDDSASATASRLNSAVYRLLMLLFLLTTCDCFLRDLPSQYQAVQVKGELQSPLLDSSPARDHKSAIGTLVGRTTRYVMLVLLAAAQPRHGTRWSKP